jgi:hypothetical protein
MSKKAYYISLAILFVFISFYFFIFSTILISLNIKLDLSLQTVVKFSILLILVFETAFNSILLKYALFSTLFIGYFSIVQHWPFGRLIFYITGLILILNLILKALKEKTNQKVTFYIISIPTYYLMARIMSLFYPCWGILSILNFILIAIVSYVLIKNLYLRKIKFD